MVGNRKTKWVFAALVLGSVVAPSKAQECSKALLEEACEAGFACYTFKRADFSDSSPSVFYYEANGRFGNHLQAYLLLLGLRLVLLERGHVGATFLLPRISFLYLTKVFTESSLLQGGIKVLEADFYDQFPFSHFAGKLGDLIDDKELLHGRFLHIYPSKGTGRDQRFRTEEHQGPHLDKVSILSTGWVNENLRFREDLRKRATDQLTNVSNTMKKKLSVKDDITLVAIHNRRTDVTDFYRKPLLKPGYFYEAMDHFREDFDDRVAFVFASDDMAWARKHLRDMHRDLFLVGNGETDREQDLANTFGKDFEPSWAYDFTILSLCNHTIASIGTFSDGVVIMTGGEFYTPDEGIRLPYHYLKRLSGEYEHDRASP